MSVDLHEKFVFSIPFTDKVSKQMSAPVVLRVFYDKMYPIYRLGWSPCASAQTETRLCRVAAHLRAARSSPPHRRSRPQFLQHQTDGGFRLQSRRFAGRGRFVRTKIRQKAHYVHRVSAKWPNGRADLQLEWKILDSLACEWRPEEGNCGRLLTGGQAQSAAVFVLEQQERVLGVIAGEGVHESDGRL